MRQTRHCCLDNDSQSRALPDFKRRLPSSSLVTHYPSLSLSVRTTMVRDFHTLNDRPSFPTRSCRKKTEPFESSLIATAMMANGTVNRTSPMRLSRISMKRFRISCIFELIRPLHFPQSQERGCTLCVRSNGAQEVLKIADLLFQITKGRVQPFCQRLAPFPSKLKTVYVSKEVAKTKVFL